MTTHPNGPDWPTLEADPQWRAMRQHPLGAPFAMREFPTDSIPSCPKTVKAMAWELGGVIIVKLGCKVMTLEDWWKHGPAIYRRLVGKSEGDTFFFIEVSGWLSDVAAASSVEIARFHRNLELDTQAREVA